MSSLEPGSLGSRELTISADGSRVTAIYRLMNDIGDRGEYWKTNSATLNNGVLVWGPAQGDLPGTPQWDYHMAVTKDGTKALYVWTQTQDPAGLGVIKTVARVISGNVGALGPVQTLTPWYANESNGLASVALSDDGTRAALVWRRSLYDGTAWLSSTRFSVATVVGNNLAWSPAVDLGMPASVGVRPTSVSMSGDGTRVVVGWSDLSSRTGTVHAGATGLDVAWGPITSPPAAITDVEAFLVSHDGSRLLGVWNAGTTTAPSIAVAAATVSGDVATWGSTYQLPEQNARASQVRMSDDGQTALLTVVSTDEQGLHPVTSVDLLGIGPDASITAGTRRALDGADSITRSSLSGNGRVALVTSGSSVWVATIVATTATWLPPTHPFPAAQEVALSADGSRAVALWTVQVAQAWVYQMKSRAGFPDTTAPVVRMTAPTTTFTTSARIGVAWTVTDGGSGVKTSAARWTRAPANGGTFSPWTAPSTWLALTSRSLTATAALGYQYCFQVRSTDWSGNTSAWSTPRCTRTPFDDRALSASTQWRRGLDPGWVAGTYSYTTAYGARLSTTHPMSVRQIGVIATTCRTCGTLAVYVGTTKVGALSLRSTTTRARVLLTLPRLTTSRYGPLRLVVTSHGNPIKIDAVALSNS